MIHQQVLRRCRGGESAERAMGRCWEGAEEELSRYKAQQETSEPAWEALSGGC